MLDGYDVLQGLGFNRDGAAIEETVLVYSGTSIHPYVDEIDDLTLLIENNVAPSAQLTIQLYFGP